MSLFSCVSHQGSQKTETHQACNNCQREAAHWLGWLVGTSASVAKQEFHGFAGVCMGVRVQYVSPQIMVVKTWFWQSSSPAGKAVGALSMAGMVAEPLA